MGQWAEPEIDRYQQTLFAPTLDAMIPSDHPVRLFDELLRSMDWSAWEGRYNLRIGQPPIHPRVVAGVILYGLTRGVRSSRQLEYACGNAVDFMWLAERQGIDHSTICAFRGRFRGALKDLFKQMGQLAMRMGLVRLNEVGLDGTRIRANSSRHGMATAATLAGRLAALDDQIEAMLSAAEAADAEAGLCEGSRGTAAHLPRHLADAARRRARLEQALAQARAAEGKAGDQAQREGTADEADAATPADPARKQQQQQQQQQEQKQEQKQEQEQHKKKKGPRVPVADPESTVLPNKEGGYAPNYTVLAAADGAHGLLVDAAVIADNDEGAHTLETVDRVTDRFGERPARLLADTAFGSGPILAGLVARGVEGYIPQAQREDRASNPAHRADPTAAVPEADWPRLPRSTRTGKLDRAAFLYDGEADCYWCPMGHRLTRWQRRDRDRRRGRVENWLYRGAWCEECPLAGECLSGRGSRTVSRDVYEALREAMDARLGSEEGQARYRRRSPIAETPHAVTKGQMGVRQFLTRGLEQVTTEWWWVCTAYNLKKLVRLVTGMRERLWALAV